MDHEYYEWRTELLENMPKTLLTHASNLRLNNDSFSYCWYGKLYTVPYETIWDYRHHCETHASPLEVLESYIAKRTPINSLEISEDSYWTLDDDLRWNIVFYRGDYPLKKHASSTVKPKLLDYETDFIVEHKGAILYVREKFPCPAPSSALSNGVQAFLDNIDPLFAYSSDLYIVFSDPHPLLCGNKDALERLLSQGSHPYGNLYSLKALTEEIHYA